MYGLGGHALLEPDEGRYSEIPREMIESGDFNTPKLNYVKYFEKPALFYWMNAASFKIFGENEFAARFPTALCAVLGGMLLFYFTKSIYGIRSAFISTFALFTMLLYLGVGQINIIDMSLSFFIAFSLIGFWMKRYWMFYLGMALALLSKGLIGIVLPGGIVFWYIVFLRRWDILKSLLCSWGIVLFFAVSLPWFITVCIANNDFFYFFFIQEHFLRYATKMHDRYEPVWFFIPILILGLMPWVGFLPHAVRSMFNVRRRKLKDGEIEQDSPQLFITLWFVIIFAFFSFSSSKLIPYIVPLLFPIAAMFGKQLDDIIQNNDAHSAKRVILWSSPLFVLIALASVIYPLIDDNGIGALELFKYTFPLGVSSVLFVLSGLYFLRKGDMKKFAAGVMVTALLFSFAAKRGFELMGETRAARDTAQIIAEHKREGDLVAQIWDYDQGLPFYLKQRIILIEWLGELTFGAKQEKDPSWFLRENQLPELWKSEKKLFLVVNKKEGERLKRLLASSDITLPDPIGESHRNFIYVNKVKP